MAYRKGGILHGDMSALGNTMPNLHFGDILNDWDYAINANVVRESHLYRTVCGPSFIIVIFARLPIR